MGFLHHVSEACGINKMTVSNLAVVIAPNIIRGSTSSSTMEGSNIKLETQLVESLIQVISKVLQNLETYLFVWNLESALQWFENCDLDYFSQVQPCQIAKIEEGIEFEVS